MGGISGDWNSDITDKQIKIKTMHKQWDTTRVSKIFPLSVLSILFHRKYVSALTSVKKSTNFFKYFQPSWMMDALEVL